MKLITQEIKEIASKIRVFAVATASKDGKPNVVAISFVKILSDEEILVMDNFMEKTKKKPARESPDCHCILVHSP